MTEKIRILFLAANPIDTGRLHVDKEWSQINDQLKMATDGNRFELIVQLALTTHSLQDALLTHKPHIVHFSGHGSRKRGIVLENYLGKGQMISKPDLTRLFEILKDNISIIVLNACYSRLQADGLAEVIDYTIGVRTTISDNAAINFAASFYRSLAHKRSVKEAFELANNLLKMEGVTEKKLPEILIGKEVDVFQSFLPKSPPEPVVQSLSKPHPDRLVQPFSKDTTLTVTPLDINPIPKRIMQIIRGIILIITLFFTWYAWEARIEREAKTELANKTLREERYTKAVDQFNSQTSVIGRANAIENLGQLAADPDFNGYYGRIINTIVTFIRENSKPKKNANVQQNEKISDDVQTALRILGWRSHKWGDKEEPQRLDLSGLYLPEADIKHGTEPEGAHMEGAQFINTNLERAMLREVNLENAILRGANLRFANLYKANLTNANLLGADLEGADLQYAKGLTIEQIKLAKNWNRAFFIQKFENELRGINQLMPAKFL